MLQRSKRVVWGVLVALLTSCQSGAPAQKPELDVYYEKDLKVCINGDCFSGTGVPDPAIEYDIEVRARGDNDFLLFETCHLWKKFENEGKKVEFKYIPVDEIENTGECPMSITSLNASNKKNAWAFVGFPDTKGKYNMPAYLRCNGFEGQTKHGVSVCQSAHGLVQQINFPRPVFTSRVGDCVMKSEDGKKFEWKMKKGECVYLFKEQGADNWHRLYTVGIEASLFRGD